MAEGLLNYFNQQINSPGGGGGSSPSFIPARVYDIVLDETHPRFDEVGQWNGIGTIFYQTIDAMTNASSSENKAKPALANLKNYPLTNEVVYLFALPTPESQTSGQDNTLYYLNPANIWNSQHHNALPNILLTPDGQQPDYEETEAGVVRRVTDGSTEIELGETFVEKTNINPLLPFEGDVIHEGRWGNSIRFGSTVNGKTNWSETGENGDPITIIRNGEDPNNGDEGWVPVVENINSDLSSIWMTSTQQTLLEAASSLNNSYSTPPDTLDQYAGSQIIINSDRVVLNSKTDHIMLSSAKSVSLSALESINIDTKEHIIDANNIKLGSKDATEPLMLGDKTVDLLGNILDELSSVMGQLSGLVSLPPGAPFVPLNAQAIQSQIKLNLYKNQLRTLLSKQNKTV
ncbi:MAG: hypothetical protein HKN40_05860 [Winogradskyella sp.]|uniref:hypothetical protein n=1 Tax=Winogradskyella sp. TaxID=1883156 RepID=UPI00181DE380|nr:hypothetical protein [Winogradskyella sp.]